MPQSLANILIHTIWSTKERRPIISDGVREGLHGYVAGILKNLESPALIINSVADHVHVLCQLSKNLAACKLVEEVKKGSSKWMKDNGIRNSRGKVATVCFRSVNRMRKQFVITSRGSRNITSRRISRMSFANFANDIMSPSMNDMCGIDFVTPFQGLDLFGNACSQGAALGCLVARFQRAGKDRLAWCYLRWRKIS